jgi:hypothetical protein
MTSATDGRTHRVKADDFDAGVGRGHGRYRAACGREVMGAPLIADHGPRCHDYRPPPGYGSAHSRRFTAALANLARTWWSRFGRASER